MGNFSHTRTHITVSWHLSTFSVNTRYRHGGIIPIALHSVCSSLAKQEVVGIYGNLISKSQLITTERCGLIP